MIDKRVEWPPLCVLCVVCDEHAPRQRERDVSRDARKTEPFHWMTHPNVYFLSPLPMSPLIRQMRPKQPPWLLSAIVLEKLFWKTKTTKLYSVIYRGEGVVWQVVGSVFWTIPTHCSTPQNDCSTPRNDCWRRSQPLQSPCFPPHPIDPVRLPAVVRLQCRSCQSFQVLLSTLATNLLPLEKEVRAYHWATMPLDVTLDVLLQTFCHPTDILVI